jgi:cytochrome c
MKILKFVLIFAAVIGFVFAYGASQAGDAPGYGAPGYGSHEMNEPAPSYGEADGSIAKGKALFNDPKFGSGTSGMSCNSCHPNGRGLEKSGAKSKFNIMGATQSSLEEAVNICIVRPLKGAAIDPESQDMKDIVSYIKSLGKS